MMIALHDGIQFRLSFMLFCFSRSGSLAVTFSGKKEPVNKFMYTFEESGEDEEEVIKDRGGGDLWIERMDLIKVLNRS